MLHGSTAGMPPEPFSATAMSVSSPPCRRARPCSHNSASNPSRSINARPSSRPTISATFAVSSAFIVVGASTVTLASSLSLGRPVRGSIRWCISCPPVVQLRRITLLVAIALPSRCTTARSSSGARGSPLRPATARRPAPRCCGCRRRHRPGRAPTRPATSRHDPRSNPWRCRPDRSAHPEAVSPCPARRFNSMPDLDRGAPPRRPAAERSCASLTPSNSKLRS